MVKGHCSRAAACWALGICFVIMGCETVFTADENTTTKKQQNFTAHSQLLTKLLSLDPPEVERLKQAEQKGLIELAPVILPEGENLLGENHHLGWPVATMVDDTIIVIFNRTPSHWQKRKAQFSSSAVAVRSTDGGKTWSQQKDLRQFAKQPSEGVKISWGNAIGTASDGTVYVVCPYGLFTSSDKGQTWQHIPEALTDKQLSGPGTIAGPRIVEHPQYGLLVPCHHIKNDSTNNIVDMWLRYSTDKGQTWKEVKTSLPSFAKPVEPAALVWKNSLIILARCHGGSFEPETKTWRYVQMHSRDDWSGLQMQTELTNIRTSDVRESPSVEYVPPWGNHFGPYSQDTPDIAFNPFTGRIEAVTTNRTGGGQGKEHIHTHMTLNLWSIDPEKLLAGSSQWQFEGTLLTRRGTSLHKQSWDGMHPGGAVIDTKNGVQHIFVYLGYTAGPSGIFRITRTLDTNKLSDWLKKKEKEKNSR